MPFTLHCARRKPTPRSILTSDLPGMFCGGMDLRMTAQGDAQDLRAFLYKFYMETMISNMP
jgi:hypothetical protein